MKSLCSGDCGMNASGSQCCLKPRSVDALHKYFGHDSFRLGQLEAILFVLHGRDVFVRMATGSGKSLCMYLVPLSVTDTAMGIIISPLCGLMNQQVSGFHSLC